MQNDEIKRILCALRMGLTLVKLTNNYCIKATANSKMTTSFKTVNLSELNLDMKTMQKMIFIYNCLEKGWSVKKRDSRYIFQKNHEGKKEVFMEDYLDKFISENLSL